MGAPEKSYFLEVAQRHKQYIYYKTLLEDVAQCGTTGPRAGSIRKSYFLEVAHAAQPIY